MSKKPLRVGLVGYGFMGRTHSNAYRQVSQFFDVDYRPVLQAVCGRSREKAESFASQWGYDSVETDWRDLIDRKDIDVVDIASPNNTHVSIAIAAAEAGKMCFAKSPWAEISTKRSAWLRRWRVGVSNMVWYNYRRVPAVTLAKQLIDEGRLGP